MKRKIQHTTQLRNATNQSSHVRACVCDVRSCCGVIFPTAQGRLVVAPAFHTDVGVCCAGGSASLCHSSGSPGESSFVNEGVTYLVLSVVFFVVGDVDVAEFRCYRAGRRLILVKGAKVFVDETQCGPTGRCSCLCCALRTIYFSCGRCGILCAAAGLSVCTRRGVCDEGGKISNASVSAGKKVITC